MEEAEQSQTANPHGIKVHGHWVLEVKDKDGKTVNRREFENSLQSSNYLSDILAGLALPGPLAILVQDSSNVGYMITDSTASTAGICPASSGTTCVPGLVMTASLQNSGVTLHGQFTAASALSISVVETVQSMCYNTTTAGPPTGTIATCRAATADTRATGNVFTGTAITPLAVAAGQTLAVTVAISFS